MPAAVPQMSYGQVRATARRPLPGMRNRRHMLRQYSPTREKPARRSGTDVPFSTIRGGLSAM